MRHYPIICLLLAAFVLCMPAVVGQVPKRAMPGLVPAGPYSVSYSVDDLTFDRIAGYDVVGLGEDGQAGPIGAPSLPVMHVRVAIPSDTEAVGVRIVNGRRTVLDGRFDILPTQPAIPISKAAPAPQFAPPNPAIYSQATPYPGRLADCRGGGSMSGYRIADVALYPLQYVPADGKLVLYENIEFEIYLAPLADDPPRIAVRTRASEELFRKAVAAIVLNPDEVPDHVAARVIDGPERMSGEIVEELIITSSLMQSAFDDLAAWKTRKGVPTEVVTTGWINDNYMGDDDMDRIRKCIKDYWQNKGCVWVILGGDTSKVRYRPGYAQAADNGNAIPCDLYYSDLDGTWNDDGDGRYGEYPSDNVDMYADVYVGRFAADTWAEADRIASKVLQYEASSFEPAIPLDYQQKLLFLGSELDEYTDCKILKDTIDVESVGPEYDITKLYQSEGTLSASKAVAELDKGYGFCNHAGHGTATQIQMGATYMTSNDAYFMVNDPRFTNMYSVACYANDFTYNDCLGERFQLAPDGGGFYVGNSRYGWYLVSQPASGPSAVFDRYYWWCLCHLTAEEVPKHAGSVFGVHKDMRVGACKGGETGPLNRYVLYELNLMGDPETPLWLHTPGSLSVSHAATLSLGGSDFTVTVSDGASSDPVEGARVCLYKEGDVYLVDYTDAGGSVTLYPSPASGGTVLVTVTALDYLPSETSAEVQQYATTTAPDGFINPGWVWFSLPIVPVDPNAGAIFGEANVQNKLYRWDPVIKTIQLYPDDFTDLEMGRGYTLLSSTWQQPSYQGTPADSPFAIHIPLQGWLWFGCPFEHEVLTDNLWVENLDAGQTRTAEQDFNAADPWINWNFIWWYSGDESGGGDTAELCCPTFLGTGDAYLRPWYGYRLYAMSENLNLYVPGD